MDGYLVQFDKRDEFRCGKSNCTALSKTMAQYMVASGVVMIVDNNKTFVN